MDLLGLNQANRRHKQVQLEQSRTPIKAMLVEDKSTGWPYVVTVFDGNWEIKQENGLSTILPVRSPNGTIYTGDNSQISVTATTGLGDDVSSDPETTVVYSSEDVSIATVSGSGLITALQAGSINITVSVTYRGVTLEAQMPLLVLYLDALSQKVVEAQAAYDFAIEGIIHGYYPFGSKAVLLSAINDAQGVIDSHTTQIEIDDAEAALSTALSNFQASAVVINTSALSESIAEATTMKDNAVVGTGVGEYPQSAIDDLILSIQVAQLTLDAYQNKNQAEIDTATADMNADKADFLAEEIQAGDSTALEAEVTTATTKRDSSVVGEEPGDFTQESVDTLSAAITTAETAVANKATLTQAELDSETAALSDAIATFDASIIPAV